MQKQLHVRYFLDHLRALPEPYASQDCHRLVLAFFCVHGLAVLGELDRVDRQRIIDWVYAHQIVPNETDPSLNMDDCGFRGSLWIGNTSPDNSEAGLYDTSNIAATYAALCILRTLGDDYEKVNKKAIVAALKSLQNKTTGGFSSVRFGSEEDMRFVYCACAISHLLDDWSGIDLPAMVRFVNAAISFDGAIGIDAGTEGQGGATYCAIASLMLAGRMMQLELDQADLVRWLVFRQHGGFQGRCNKTPDACYAFWNGATLHLLGKHSFVDTDSCRQFVLSCEFAFGGFCKYPASVPGIVPDVMHSYYSLAWLSIAQESESQRDQTNTQEGTNASTTLVPLDVKLQIPVVTPRHS